MIRAFLRGMFEFRRDLTTHYDEPEVREYDKGRELAHRWTFRIFEADDGWRTYASRFKGVRKGDRSAR